MDVRDALLELLAPLALGAEIAPGLRLVQASAETGPRLVFDAGGEAVLVEVTPAEAGLPAAASTARLRFSYVSHGPVAAARGFQLCRLVAGLAAKNEARVLEALAEGAENAPRTREVQVARLLEEARDGSRRFHTLSPYVGCIIGCRFCYAQTHVAAARRLAGLPDVAWGSYVDVRINAPDVLARELDEQDVELVKFCPIVSDPYQAPEKRYGVTRACLEVLAKHARKPAVLVLTRSKLVERDAELLGVMRAHVGVSIPTADDEVRAHFEPRAASVEERLGVLRTMRAAGALPFAVVQPLLPGSIERLADALAAVGASVSVDVLQGIEGAAEDFRDPRWAHAAEKSWQQAQADVLREALRARGLPLWAGELPTE